MGRQFQVYMLPSDALGLIGVLEQEVGASLISPRSPRPEPITAGSPIQTKAGFERVSCLLAPHDSSAIKLNYLERQNQWSVDILFSEVIELEGCHYDGKTLKRGRFFYDPGFYKAEAWKNKSPSFLKWAETVFKLSKEFLTRVPRLEAYIGRDAERWSSGGGVLIPFSVDKNAK